MPIQNIWLLPTSTSYLRTKSSVPSPPMRNTERLAGTERMVVPSLTKSDMMCAATSRLRSEGRDAAWCPCFSADGDAHAGHTETSVLLHISPADVHTEDWCRGNGTPLAGLMPALRQGGVAAVSEVGVLGDPTTATRADGARIFAEMVADCRLRIGRWSPSANGVLV